MTTAVDALPVQCLRLGGNTFLTLVAALFTGVGMLAYEPLLEDTSRTLGELTGDIWTAVLKQG